MKEVWPFLDETSGTKIQEHRFYGFGDAGGLAGSFEGYKTQQEAITEISKLHSGWGDYDVIGTDPEELGNYAILVMTGRQFVDQLNRVMPDDGGCLFYGKWSDETNG